MVGDRRYDVVGLDNGMSGIGALYGYGSEAELIEARAYQVCASSPPES
jgi:phosphoglycolate phosphatase